MGITQQTLEFLAENRLRNDKAWYNEHKEDYRTLVLKPLTELVEALTPQMLKIDEDFITEPKIDRTISRIYRDTRFSADKSLYRDNCWIVFMKSKKLYFGMPAYYFEMRPTGFEYGMGYYMASTATMQAIRGMIQKREASFLDAIKAYETQNRFVLTGDSFKRSKYPDEPENIRLWLDKKSLSFNCCSADFDLLYSDPLVDELIEGFKELEPIYRFLIRAEERKTAL